ncbi:Rieske 2Fe-2S domain-containing protein [Streptomyces sp. NPDC059564]|uniref:Rieske 2Fe-2S domain-containing protein n=1 Tax=Streptomyces sp. NPDC059564 TaxID=3346865 RepID=UPI0036C23B6B
MTPTTPAQHGPRVIEAAAPPDRFARGRHCLGLAADFAGATPHEVEAFGTRLVVFRGAGDGALHALNAYCPHVGGNLAHGTVKGDTVACPFHDWRWSGDGRCAAVPYARRVPPRARTRAWTTLERNGQLYVWHDPEGNPPPADVTIPEIAGFGHADWSGWSWNSLRVENANCREIVDNVVDMAHFYYVHYAFPHHFKNVFDGHVATQYMESTPRGDVDLGTLSTGGGLRSDASYHGPSYMIDRLWSDVGGGQESLAADVFTPAPARSARSGPAGSGSARSGPAGAGSGAAALAPLDRPGSVGPRPAGPRSAPPPAGVDSAGAAPAGAASAAAPSAAGPPVVPEPAGAPAVADVELDGRLYRLAWDRGTPLLDALLAAGVPAPYSCREGACAACCCRVLDGEVTMIRNEVLDDTDLAEGHVLACQALPLGPAVRITYG